jgi:hypothetical protein
MDKKIAGLLGAVAGLATMSTAQAAISPASNPAAGSKASSYADLLAPIANPIAQLQADDAMRAQQAVEPMPELQLAQAYSYTAYPYNAHPYANNHHHLTTAIPGITPAIITTTIIIQRR